MLYNINLINQDGPWFFYIFFFCIGACVGSFLNVCIYRIPANLSVIRPASRCGNCGASIPFYHNIPILSWFILRGKCYKCGAKFSFRYPLIEIITALLFTVTWIVHPNLIGICGMIMISMLIAATMIDFDHMFIPDRFSLGLALVGFILSAALPQLHGCTDQIPALAVAKSLVQSGLGIIISSGVLLWIGMSAEIIFRKEAVGFGDVKLIGGIGAFLGWQGGLVALFGGAVIGCILLFPYMGIQKLWQHIRKGKRSETNTDTDGSVDKTLMAYSIFNDSMDELEDESPAHIPFGPMLSIGAIVYFLGADKWMQEMINSLQEI